MSDYMPHIAVVVVAALVAAALVWVARGWTPTSWRWRDAALRTLSVVIGGWAGLLLGGVVEGVGGWPWGAALGAGGGLLATAIVAAVRSRIKLAGGDDG